MGENIEDCILDENIFSSDLDFHINQLNLDWKDQLKDQIDSDCNGVYNLIKRIVILRKYIYYWSIFVEIGVEKKDLLKSIKRNKCLSEIAKSFEKLRILSKDKDKAVKTFALEALFFLKPESIEFALNLNDNSQLLIDNSNGFTKYLLDYAYSLKNDFVSKEGLKLVWKRKLIQIGTFRCSGSSYFSIDLNKKRICIGGCILDLHFHNSENTEYDAIYILPDITIGNINANFVEDLIIKTYGKFIEGITIDLFCFSELLYFLGNLDNDKSFQDFISFDRITNQLNNIKNQINVDLRVAFLKDFFHIHPSIKHLNYWALVGGAVINNSKKDYLEEILYGYDSSKKILIPRIKIDSKNKMDYLIHPRESHLKLNHHKNYSNLNTY